MKHPQPHKTYEMASLPEKALGKIHQLAAQKYYQAPLHIPAGFRAISICFDDFPESAAMNGAAVLEESGSRGTFYTCFGTLGMESENGILASLETVRSLMMRGHEIACHTHSHINASFNTADIFTESCKKNIRAASASGIRLAQFSYPQGGMSIQAKKMVREYYQSARSGFMGINKGTSDVFCLKSVPLYQDHSYRTEEYLTQLERQGGWLILFTHDVSATPTPHGIATETLQHIMQWAKNKDIPVRTVGSVLYSLRSSHE